jgi:hypothetical protein
LAILHEGEFTKKEVADEIGEDVRYVSGHVDDLYKSGCIELARYKVVRGRLTAVYRAVILPLIDREEFMAMSLEDRHDLIGIAIQSLQVESVCSFRNGRMGNDENLCLMWQPLHLDAKGREELLARQLAWREEGQKIEKKSARRMARSGDKGRFSIMAFLGFQRGRDGKVLDLHRNAESAGR